MRHPAIYIDHRGFVYADDVRLPMRSLPDGTLEFQDKDRRRNSERGSDKVVISLDHLVKVLKGDK